MRAILLFLILASFSFSFTIDSYENNLTILSNGDVHVQEKIAFSLEEQYNEGFRSIRPDEMDSLDNLNVNSVRVNGIESGFRKQVYDGNYEVVWTETHPGQNIVELDYIITDKVEIFDDFARVCYEHFGANWDPYADHLLAITRLPESSLGKEMHFEVYSEQMGNAYIDNDSVIIEMDFVPPGNYVGGCYLFDKEGIQGKRVEGSAKEILDNERELYGSVQLLGPDDSYLFCCLPLLIISLIFAGYAYINRRVPKYGGSILPPGKDDPIYIGFLVNGNIDKKNVLGATILDLIDRGFIEIFEDFEGESNEKTRTVLKLKKEGKLEPYEQKAIDMIFYKEKEVDLDKLADEIGKINSKSDANKHPITDKIEDFDDEYEKHAKKYNDIKMFHNNRAGGVAMLAFALMAGVMFIGIALAIDSNDPIFAAFLFILSLVIFSAGAWIHLKPRPPKNHEEDFEKWEAFKRGLESSRLNEYPPSSVEIWDRIIVYATILGIAKKVEKHLSELDKFTLKRMKSMQKISTSSALLYSSAYGLSNLSKYGNKSGFTSSSSGGWSSGGGGGFSGGSSGGGGFR